MTVLFVYISDMTFVSDITAVCYALSL